MCLEYTRVIICMPSAHVGILLVYRNKYYASVDAFVVPFGLVRFVAASIKPLSGIQVNISGVLGNLEGGSYTGDFER
jgi:hypothetical protein